MLIFQSFNSTSTSFLHNIFATMVSDYDYFLFLVFASCVCSL